MTASKCSHAQISAMDLVHDQLAPGARALEPRQRSSPNPM